MFDNSDNIRKARVAGMFYPGKEKQLEKEISDMLASKPVLDFSGHVHALIVPHAGYMYSGEVAARAYNLLVGNHYDKVVVISPSHREYFTHISVFDGIAYETPLGLVPVDKVLSGQLAEKDSLIQLSASGHRADEHALEVQLPFLQKTLEKFDLIPVVMGDQKMSYIDALSQGLGSVLEGKKALIVASTDLSHFYSYDKAKQLDKAAEDSIGRFDADELYDKLQKGSCEMCGGGPAIVAMKAARMLGADKSRVLLYRNSGDVINQKSEVVGYLSAVLYN